MKKHHASESSHPHDLITSPKSYHKLPAHSGLGFNIWTFGGYKHSVRKQQLELYIEQQNGSKSGKAYIKAVYFHFVYLTYMQSTS